MTDLDVFADLLATSTRSPQVVLEVERPPFGRPLLGELHAMASALMLESFDHFCRHADTNDELHVFRCAKSREIGGFQFWRHARWHERGAVILGGKLRIRPEFRRNALHLLAGLRYLAGLRAMDRSSDYARCSVASIFGFSSIARHVPKFSFVARGEPGLGGELVDIVAAFARDSGYCFDEQSGLVDVAIRMSEAQLAAYPSSYFESQIAAAYIARNPHFRENGCFVPFAFAFDDGNTAALVDAVVSRLELPDGAREQARARLVASCSRRVLEPQSS